MTKTPEPEPQVRLVVSTDDGTALTLEPGETCPGADALLDARGAETLVILPLWAPHKVWKKPDRFEFGRRLEKRRKRLGKGEWGEGQLERVDGGSEPVPCAWQLDLRRYRARLVADELGLREFYWVCRGGPVERHAAELFDDDESFDLDSVRSLSRAGLAGLGQTAARLDELPRSVRAVGSDPARLARAAAFTLGLALLLATTLALAAGSVEDPGAIGGRLARALGVLAHPVLLPALALGAYMRHHLGIGSRSSPGVRRRELSIEETSRAWNESAPHLLAVWLLAAGSILILTVGRLAAARDLSALGVVDDATGYCLIVLWILTPLSYARDTASALGACLEAGLTVVIALFVLKITLFAVDLATHFLWMALAGLVPFAIPDWIREPFDALTAIAAELLFFTLFLGYTWTKTREHFGRWATVPAA